ncbi:TonB family protein [Pedobacter hartonius]|uniref:TonB family C-terminal domain-containing protein n=1 Tax=Pedobacter hartonius TaxID=425514 RepID=A0A1H4HL77_9SPHI|nr:TonB family protein [Pedobacter hartonius]SEB21788.1 TonB family C-terminal domain-containing protein [Pedobacter hartonius]
MNKILTLFLLFLGCCVKAQQPVLTGGMDSFIRQNIIYPAYSYQNCVQGVVRISFKLNKQGAVYSSKVSNGPGIDLDQEALRLIRMSSGKWKVPADYDTTYVLVAPVNFRLSSEDYNRVTQQDMNKAIAVYKANEGLTDAITNFYRNKAQGKYNEGEEKKVIALKTELGYDDDYLNKKIQEGQKKLKQKDRQGACEDFLFVKYMGSTLADDLLEKYCK